jgi:hypothetical protein
MANVVGLHWCGISVVNCARSGRPVGAPALSLHFAMLLGSSTKMEVVPTIANDVWHASIVPLVESSGVSLESHAFTTTLRQATPPLVLM